MKRKILIGVIFLFLCFIGGPYKYNNEKVVTYIKEHKSNKSRCMCAWYSMKAIRHGGCHYCYIYPGYAYNKILPQLGFIEVSLKNNYIPQKGDISVLPKNSKSCFGHIAIYDGSHWVSDFEQKDIFPGKKYKESGKYQIFRIEDGWHFALLSLNINDIFEYIQSLIIGYKRINW